MDYIKEEIHEASIKTEDDVDISVTTIDSFKSVDRTSTLPVDNEDNYDHVEHGTSNFESNKESNEILQENKCVKNLPDLTRASGSGSEMNLNKCNANSSSNPAKGVVKSARTLKNALCALSVYGDTSSSEEEDYSVDVDDDDNDNSEVHDNYINQSVNRIHNDGDNPPILSSTFTKARTVCLELDDISSVSSLSSASPDIIFSDESDFSDDEDDVDIELSMKKRNYSSNKKQALRTKGELSLDELPPIQDLCISVPQDECVMLGEILNIVDKLVLVQGIKDLPPLDLDTVLFLEWNKPLGKVFDVIGPVVEPLYCVRFNSSDHIKEKDISIGLPVYYVPDSKHTKYVFLAHLMRIKGSDASWEENNEPPAEFVEYSDDETERRAQKSWKRRNKQRNARKNPEGKTESCPTAYERRMNELNLKMSNVQNYKSESAQRNRRKKNRLIHSPAFIPTSSAISSTASKHFNGSTTSFINSSPLSSNVLPGFRPLSCNSLSFLPPVIPSGSGSPSTSVPFQQVFNNNCSIPSTSPQYIASSKNFPGLGNLSVPPPTQRQITKPDFPNTGNMAVFQQLQIDLRNPPNLGNLTVPPPMQPHIHNKNLTNLGNMSLPPPVRIADAKFPNIGNPSVPLQTQIPNTNFSVLGNTASSSVGAFLQNMFSAPPAHVRPPNMFSSPPPSFTFVGNSTSPSASGNSQPPNVFTSPPPVIPFTKNLNSTAFLPESLGIPNTFSSPPPVVSFNNNNNNNNNNNAGVPHLFPFSTPAPLNPLSPPSMFSRNNESHSTSLQAPPHVSTNQPVGQNSQNLQNFFQVSSTPPPNYRF